VKGLEQEYSPVVAFFWCMLTVGWFVLLVAWVPPIIAAAGYTAMSIVVYRICHATFTQMNYGGSDVNNTVAAFMCAAAWPLYFLFGACMFLRRAIRQE
jgi:hypothetical protein|tara:strand:- start:442 stop:735 length:294 start_codon:yes stop_codon:yes gene_type:complete